MATNRTRLVRLAICALLAALGASCGTIDGTDPYALWRTYEDPGRAYHFHYPSPPWTKADDSAFALPVFEVDPDEDPLAELPAARLRLEARMYVPADLEDVLAIEVGTWHISGYSTSPHTEFVGGSGDVGVRLEARREERWVRQVFFEERGTVVTLLIWGADRDDSDSPDLELLLESFEPRGAGDD
jgi:hypothetical protein